MKAKCIVFTILAVFLVLAMNLDSEAVSTRGIDKVRNKEVLNTEDLQIIDDFIAEAVKELVKNKDFTSISKIRAIILSKQSAQAQYAEQFYESAYKHISNALKASGEITPEDLRAKIMANLLILVDSLENIKLADLAIESLKDQSIIVRYWAVHILTNPSITKQINADKSASSKLTDRITEQLKGAVEQANPDMLASIAQFAVDIGTPKGEDLLLKIVDMRISKYANWTVEYELLDNSILKLLCSKTGSTESNRSAVFASRFGQLYSYVIQRYIKGADLLNDTQKQQLASVLTGVEKFCISKLLGVPQSVIKKAVERDNHTGLLLEHSRLLGDKTRAGKLVSKLNFDYGKNPDGSKRIAPLALPEPPNTGTSE